MDDKDTVFILAIIFAVVSGTFALFAVKVPGMVVIAVTAGLYSIIFAVRAAALEIKDK
jgi:hypothetical protein